jgi:hypothetical protein
MESMILTFLLIFKKNNSVIFYNSLSVVFQTIGGIPQS